MAWNEPGGDKKDPWSGRDKENGPPDLDEVMRSMQEKLGGLFGRGKGGGQSSSSLPGLGLIAIVALILWTLTGLYIVDAGNRGVETRFGAYTETTLPGLHWHLPTPIEAVDIINIEQQRFLEIGYRSGEQQQSIGLVPREALMLTEDENIVNVQLAVQFQVKDAKDFLFNVVGPAATLKQVTESAQRGVIGNSSMDFVLTEGRTEVVSDIKGSIQEIMDGYKAGVLVTSVNLQDAQPPEEVQAAFEDAIKAREDKQRFINEAKAYRNEVLPKARGAGARRVQDAEAYKARVVSRSEGEASRFKQLLIEYNKAPEVTRKRLYLDSIESVIKGTNTVMIDVKSSNNLVYLPLDKLTGTKSTPVQSTQKKADYIKSPESSITNSSNARQSSRGRDGRGR